MNWDAIGAMGEWAGAVAVVVTLFYLAMQVRQSNVVALAEAERDFWTTWHGVVNRVGVDLEAALSDLSFSAACTPFSRSVNLRS